MTETAFKCSQRRCWKPITSVKDNFRVLYLLSHPKRPTELSKQLSVSPLLLIPLYPNSAPNF